VAATKVKGIGCGIWEIEGGMATSMEVREGNKIGERGWNH